MSTELINTPMLEEDMIALIESIDPIEAQQLLSKALSMAIRSLSKLRDANKSPLCDIIADMRFLQATKFREHNKQRNNHIYGRRYTEEHFAWFCETRYKELVPIALGEAFATSHDNEQRDKFAVLFAIFEAFHLEGDSNCGE